jgi:uncharacterized protein involved in outer membrane biogenesis
MDRLKNIIVRRKKVLVGALVLLLLFSIIGFLVLPPLVKSYAGTLLSRAFGRDVSFESVRINPFRLSLTVRGLAIRMGGEAEPRTTVGEAYLNLEVTSLLRRAIVLSEVRITQPYFRIDRYEEGVYSFSPVLERDEFRRLLDKLPARFSISNIQITGGSVDFVDKPKGKRHQVRDLNLSIPFVSSIPHYVEAYVQPAFSANVNGTPYALQGKSRPFADSVETTLDLNISSLNIPFYVAYLPFDPGFRVRDGQLDMKAKVSFLLKKDGTPAVVLSGDFSVKNLALDDTKNQGILKLPQLDVSIASADPFVRAFRLSKIALQAPEVDVWREKNGTINLLSLLTSLKGSSVPQVPEAVPLSVEIGEVVVAKGKIRLVDFAATPPFKSTIDPVDFNVRNFSLAKNSRTEFDGTVRTEAGEEISLKGDLSVDPLQSQGSFSATALLLKKYAPYYTDYLSLDLVDGRLDLASQFSCAWTGKEPTLSLSGLSASVTKLRARKAGEEKDVINIPGIALKGADFDLAKKDLKVGSVSTSKGLVHLQREKNGEINLMTWSPLLRDAPGTASPSDRDGDKPWAVNLKELSVTDYALRVEDLVPSEAVRLSITGVSLKGQDVSTTRNARGTVSLALRVNESGSVSVSGRVGLEPLSADLRVTAKNVEIRPLQAYAGDKVKMTLRSGNLGASGNVKVTLGKDNALQATYTGEASINDFSSVDALTAEDFLGWKTLSVSGMNISYNPMQADIAGVALNDFYIRFVINPDGTINLLEIFPPEQQQAAARSTPRDVAPSPDYETLMKDVKISTVTLQGGRIDFTDRFVKPNYSASLVEAGGRISGLSSEASARADLEMRGKVNNVVPVEITGKVNPFGRDLFLDVSAKVTDMDLSPMTPYSGKYSGYAIEKGKLSVDVKYVIVGRKLDSQNHIFLDQFTFGGPVESPEATKLPVRLAVALLKDRKGQINLDVPVAGSIDDPKFSVWGIVFKIILNLITKAATSPFALLGALVGGGGEELGFVEFEYGSSALAEPQQKKVEAVAKALGDRPSLKLDVEAYVDKEKDREALKQRFFQRKLQAQKLNEMLKKGVAASAVDDITIEPAEYEKYLKAAYRAEKFPKPRNVIGLEKDLPVPEMEKLMLTHIQVTDDDLRSLASQRAMKVRDAVAGSGKVEPERVFVVESKFSSPEKRQNLKESRVDLKLK